MRKKKSVNQIAFFSTIIIFLLIIIVVGNVILFGKKAKTPTTVPREERATLKFDIKPASTPEPDTVKILIAGDVLLGRTVTIESLDKNNDPTFPFLFVKEIMADSDLSFMNLESPIVTQCPRIYEGYKFCAPPEMLEGLVVSGVDVVTLANNHTYNFGKEGFNETISYLNSKGVDSVGYGNFIEQKVGDTTFGFLGFDFLTNTPTQADYDLVSESDKKVDVLIVGVHWGVEYVDTPNDYQVAIAKNLVDSGADLIAGHHPHWIQSIDEIEGVPVYYSLGNFVFDQMWSEETKKGLVIILEYDGDEIVGEEKIYTYTEKRGQPKIITP